MGSLCALKKVDCELDVLMPAARLHISVPSSTSVFAPFSRCAPLSCGIQRIQPIQGIQKIQRTLLSGRLNPHSKTSGPKYIQKSRMAGLKRKQVPHFTSSISSGHKKLKNEASQSKRPPPVLQVHKVHNTEPDSDPIVESDTTEHSGIDDGVSWPSDAAPAAQDSSAGEEGGVTISRTASKASSKVVRQPPSARHARNGMISSSVIIKI